MKKKHSRFFSAGIILEKFRGVLEKSYGLHSTLLKVFGKV
jgi:hypothetical protein